MHGTSQGVSCQLVRLAQKEVQNGTQEEKRQQSPVSLHPLDPKEALAGLLQVKPEAESKAEREPEEEEGPEENRHGK